MNVIRIIFLSILLSVAFVACIGDTPVDTEDVSVNESSLDESVSSSSESSSENQIPDTKQTSSSLHSTESSEEVVTESSSQSDENATSSTPESSADDSDESEYLSSSSNTGVHNETPYSSLGGSECNDRDEVVIKVMSYNTLYTNYPGHGGDDASMKQLGDNIINLNPTVLGTQETQDRFLLEDYTDGLLKLVPDTEGNPIYYNPQKVGLKTSGWFSIPRDDYAERTITYAEFNCGDAEFWLFNTHLPHKHNEAGAEGTHAKIAQMLLDKKQELGADYNATVITGDFNSFASDGDPQGSFESNIIANGDFAKSYQAEHWGIDKIFHSRTSWTAANGADGPHGGSDHTPIHVELTMERE